MAGNASNNIATGQASVTSGGNVVVPARADRKRVTIVNLGTTAVTLGPSGVTTANGVLLAGVVGQTLTFETAAAIYGIVASTSQTVSYIEEFA